MTIVTETIEEAVTDSGIRMIGAEEMISGVAMIENVEPTPITIGNVQNVTTPITHSEPNATAVESRKEEVAEDHNESGKVMIEEQGTERRTTAPRPGDWECPQCGKSNFAKRNECFGCGRSKRVGGPRRRGHHRGNQRSSKILSFCQIWPKEEWIDGRRDSLPRCN